MDFLNKYRVEILALAAAVDIAMISAVVYFGWHYMSH